MNVWPSAPSPTKPISIAVLVLQVYSESAAFLIGWLRAEGPDQ